jgi:hypothetical protein
MSAQILPLRAPDAKPDKFRIEMGAIAAPLQEILDTLVRGALAGRFPAIPSDDACGFCIVSSWCRTRHDTRESSAATCGGVLEQLGRETE